MADQQEIPKEDYYEVITQNAQKGESFRIQFKNEDMIYEGIPILEPPVASSDDDSFSFDVVQPPEKAGLKRKRISDIVHMMPA